MAKVTSKTDQSVMTRVIDPVVNYLRDTRAELRKVTWPTRQEAWNLTLIVLGAVVVMSIILGLADFLFAEIMRGIVTSNLIWIGVGVLVVLVGVAAVYFMGRE